MILLGTDVLIDVALDRRPYADSALRNFLTVSSMAPRPHTSHGTRCPISTTWWRRLLEG